ncbi:MAG: rhodanese-like domain-containing protein, partial [Flavitalea sp.]
DHAIGYLNGGFEAWQNAGKEIDTVESVNAEEFAERFKSADLEVIDVRKPDEFSHGHVEGAKNLPLDYINELMNEFPKDKKLYVHCAGGYRSVIAISLLKRQGIHNVRNIVGGWGAIKNEKRIETVQDKSVLN